MPSLISLAMTVCNRETHLPASLDSVLAQTYLHLDVLEGNRFKIV
jgi:glycosyltransferase involved in cell wall biosynthesis